MSEPPEKGLRVLVLDAGDIRCLSQLSIVDELLHQVKWNQKLKEPILPCDYFDVVGGVGPAGLIVALIVVFRLPVQETKDEFVKLWEAVFPEGQCTTTERSLRLERALADLFERRSIPRDQKLLDPEGKTCKGFVCAISPEAPTTCRKFRTYEGPEAGYITAMEAIRASFSSLGQFDAIKVGPPGQEETLVGAEQAFDNPIREAIKELRAIYNPKTSVNCLLSLGYGQPAILTAAKMQDAGSAPIRMLAAVQSDYLADEIEAQIGGLGVYYRFSVDRGLEAPDSIPHDNIGLIWSHTSAYLQRTNIQRRMQNVITSLEQSNCNVTIGEIGGVQSQANLTAYSDSSGEPESATRMHELPPLCASFVARPEITKAIHRSLFAHNNANHIVVISGMGGCGKTQIASHFARVYKDRYDTPFRISATLLTAAQRFKHILFTDASTSESLENGIVIMARSLGSDCQSIKEAKRFLIDTFQHSGPWLLVLDNVDDPQIDVGLLLPLCDHGYIILTTRNPDLEALSPKAYILLDVMDDAEAIEVLLKTIFTSRTHVTDESRRKASAIVKELGNLPVAVVQAGSFIRQRKCFDRYLSYLQNNRSKVLSTPAEAQLDDHYHGVYATLDVTLPVLSDRAKRVMCLMACFNYTGFPLPLIGRAARRRFSFEPYDLLERRPIFQETVDFLSSLFSPEGEWNELEFDELLMELERYSLVSRIEIYSISTLRFHPLVRAWILDQIVGGERYAYEEAALRLLICGLSEEDEDLYEYIAQHLRVVSSACERAHVNDLAGLARLACWLRKEHRDIQIWESIFTKVANAHSLRHIRTYRAQTQLARAYAMSGEPGDLMKAQDLVHDVVKHLGHGVDYEDDDRVKATTLKYQIQDIQGPYGEGVAALQRDAVNFRHEEAAKCPRMSAEIYPRWSLEVAYEARRVWVDIPQSRERWLVSDLESRTVVDWPFAFKLLQDIYKTREKWQGKLHLNTLRCQATIARLRLIHHPSSREKALEISTEVVAGWKEIHGPDHGFTLRSMEALADRRGSLEQWRIVIEGYKNSNKVYGTWHINAIKGMALHYIGLGNYKHVIGLLNNCRSLIESGNKDYSWLECSLVLRLLQARRYTDPVSASDPALVYLHLACNGRRGVFHWAALIGQEVFEQDQSPTTQRQSILSYPVASLGTAIRSIGLPFPQPPSRQDLQAPRSSSLFEIFQRFKTFDNFVSSLGEPQRRFLESAAFRRRPKRSPYEQDSDVMKTSRREPTAYDID